MSENSSPAGWYTDYANPTQLRWWDGAVWTTFTEPSQPLVSSDKGRSLDPGKETGAQPQPQRRGGLFGGKRELEAEVAGLHQQLDALGVTERDKLRGEIQELTSQLFEARAEYEQVNRMILEVRETVILQEVGVYQYRHPLDDVPAYKARLVGIQAQLRDAAKTGNAVQGSTSWTVNGSARDGAKMVREFSKLMLRAYNNEADNCVRTMKPYMLASAIARLEKAKETITRLGGTMNIHVAAPYHHSRVEELELTADYMAKLAEEKERERQTRARLRDEEIAHREFEREQERLRKEQAHHMSTALALREQGNEEAALQAETKIAEIQSAIDGITARAANIRAGHVYVISNVGAFGQNMVKIGMTRRLDPMERVRELGDASVPFGYDTHALVPSDDAVGLERQLHETLAPHRVNLVNMRREFFRVDPQTVRDILVRMGSPVLSWVEEPEALEWRQSENARARNS